MRLLPILAAALVAAACSASPEPVPTSSEARGATQPESQEATETSAEPVAEPASGPTSASNTGEMPAADTAEGVAARIGNAHGAEALANVGEVVFDFVVVNAGTEVVRVSHRWDRQNERALVSYPKDGQKIVTMVHLADRSKGWATVDGEPVDDTKRGELLEAAYARWVNDLYWLAMPLKLRDPGVNVELLEDKEIDGRPHRVLKVTYGDVGLTPGDTYWVYADAETFVVSQWDMLLEGAEEGAKPTSVSWTEPQENGGLILHRVHPIIGTPRQIVTDLKSVSPDVYTAAYAQP